MELAVRVNKTETGAYWTSLIDPICDDCGWRMEYKYHSKGRDLHMFDKKIRVVEAHYICYNPDCSNKKAVVARHPERVPMKKYSKSTIAQVIHLRYNKGYKIKQILEEMPYLSESTCYSMINSYRAARKARADERISKKFPPETKISVSIDGMEPEKGQPALYTIREVESGELLGADFLETSAAEDIYRIMHEIETKYGIFFQGFISDKQRSITTMCEFYYKDIPHQYCTVHFMKNVTAELRGFDTSLKKDIRSDIRSLSVLKTIAKKVKQNSSDLAEIELKVLAETRMAVLAIANRKKKEMFDLTGIKVYEDVQKSVKVLNSKLKSRGFSRNTPKCQLLLTNLCKKLAQILEKYEIMYQSLVKVNILIHPMFDAVMKSHPKHPQRAFNTIIKGWKMIVQDKYGSVFIKGLIEKSLKLAISYKNGLFMWRKAKVPHHNNGTERFYNVKKGSYRQYSRNKSIGITLQLTGLEEMYIPKEIVYDEILEDISIIGSEDYWCIRKEMDKRKEKRKFKKQCMDDIECALSDILSQLAY